MEARGGRDPFGQRDLTTAAIATFAFVGTIYTVGHGLQPLQHLLANLGEHEVEVVVDVRSHPVSRRAPQFGRDRLQRAIESQGMKYAWVGIALGGRPPRHLRTRTGAPDYERMAAEPATASALDRLADASEHRRLALLCSESRPEQCHRSRMLAPELEKRGIVIEHILPDGCLVARPTLFA